MASKISMTVTIDNITEAQALALQSMFNYWQQLGSLGSSRTVSFFADGDGDFRPKIVTSFSQPVHELTDEIKAASIVKDENGNRTYDFDLVYPILRRIAKENHDRKATNG